MNLSMKWLKDFVDIGEVTPREYSEALTMSGSKVEGYDVEGSELSNIVVGKINKIEKHPDADKLQVCMVDVGKDEDIQIVTAATNISVGDYVPVALDNSIIHGGQKIRKGKLRGVVSNGMFCSVAELGVTVGDFPYAIEDGIMILEGTPKVGTDIREAIGLNDTVVEFEITSNRPDCLSVIGLARETAVTFGKELKLHTPEVKGNEGDANDLLKVDIEADDLCYRYCAKIVKNVKIGPSPDFIRERLRASGVRPINNIVDITNYVMLEYGQPMHAFDLRYVKDSHIIVRRAKSGEAITTLDGVERKLSDNMLVIADSRAPVAVAGVMGGEYSGIMDDTATIVFESACFNGASVRTTARDLGMRTDASARFEKELDPNNCMPALMRACELVEMLGAGEVMGGVIDCDKSSHAERKIPFIPEQINKFLGTDISRERMVEILESLDIRIEDGMCIPPSYRGDLEHKADIAEEVARIYGYDKIATTEIRGSSQGGLNEEQKFSKIIDSVMIGSGYYQIITYSFISPKMYDKICLDEASPLRDSIVISNPLGEDSSIMRTTAIPSMLETLARNYNNRNQSAALYEIAKEYVKTDDVMPKEPKKLVIGRYGDGVDFYTVKSVVETVFEHAGIKNAVIESASDDPTFHPGRFARYKIGDRVIAILGQVHPHVQDNFGIGTPVYIASIDFDMLFEKSNFEKNYAPLPKYPSTERDIALVCDADTEVQSLKDIIESASKLTREVKLFDVYSGSQIPEGKKSVAFNIIFRADDRTLTDEECDNAVKKIMKALAASGAELRS